MKTLKYIVSYGGNGTPDNAYLKRVGDIAANIGEKHASVEGSQLHVTYESSMQDGKGYTPVSLYYDLVDAFLPVRAHVYVLTDKGLLTRPLPLNDGEEWIIETDTHACYFDTLEQANNFTGTDPNKAVRARVKPQWTEKIGAMFEPTAEQHRQAGVTLSQTFYIMLKPFGAALETTAENLNATLAQLTKLQEAYDQISEDHD